MNERFIAPKDFSRDAVVIYSIVDLEQIWQRYPRPKETPLEFMVNDFCQGFGINWWENNSEFMQLFSFRGATINEMETLPGPDEGGYNYVCFKTNAMPKGGIKMLIDGMTPSSGSDVTLLGWNHHPSRYFFHSLREACYATYMEAYKEAETIAERTGRGIALSINRDIRFGLSSSEQVCPDLKLKLFKPKNKLLEN